MDLNTIDVFVEDLAKRIMPFALSMSGIGVLSMAFIQTIKGLMPVRRWFQRSFVRKWLDRNALIAHSNFGKETGEVTGTAESRLIELSTGGDTDAFYDLPSEQLCGQLNAATQIVLQFPARSLELLRSLACNADPIDISTITSPPDFARIERDKLDTAQIRQINDLVDARNRVSHHVQRNIDGLQIAMSYRWKFILQIAAFIMSFGITFAALYVFKTNVAMPDVADAMLIGTVAGVMAPVARDLVAGLQALRKH